MVTTLDWLNGEYEMQLDMLKCFQPHAIIVIVAALRLKEVTGFQSGFGLGFFL